MLKARTDNARVRLEAAEAELRRKESLRERGTGAVTELEDAREATGEA